MVVQSHELSSNLFAVYSMLLIVFCLIDYEPVGVHPVRAWQTPDIFLSESWGRGKRTSNKLAPLHACHGNGGMMDNR